MSCQVLEEIREELREVNEKILDHPLITAAERGDLPVDAVKLFVGNQKYIVAHDSRSLALMASRASHPDEVVFFSRLSEGDVEALKLLEAMEKEVGFSDEIIPESVSYTHYLAWLALYENPGLQALAMVVNLPVWGSNCARLAAALRKNYGVKDARFLEFFSSPPRWLEKDACRIIERYKREVGFRGLKVAKIIQFYEYMFWEGLYRRVMP